MTTICCIATGPSLTIDQVETARRKGFRLYVCNNAFRVAPDAELLYACNLQWWRHYWPEVESLPAEKWTTNREAADQFGLNWVAERDAPGLSTDPAVIHHGHGSGFSLLSMAHRANPRRIVLLGYDLRYAPDYDGKRQRPGSTPRHSRAVLPEGEYPPSMQHWPSVAVRDGVHVGLVDLYRSVAEQGLVEIINATPGSAIDCFPRVDIERI